MADANFAFYGTTLHGVPQNRPRWKRAVGAVEGALGEAVGKLYVEKHFPPEAKARMDRMVGNLIEAYRQAFQNNDWMSPETKQKALAKLATFNPKIGYPKKWRDYSSLEIRRDDLVGNVQRATRLRVEPHARQARQAGGPRRMAHDSANGQRLLQRAHERDRVPGRHLAAAVLQSRRRRRRELRRHRRGDRPRNRPRLRRPGLEVGRRRQPRELVDAGRPRRVRQTRRGAGRAVRSVRAVSRLQGQRQVHARREHRRPERTDHRLCRLSSRRSAAKRPR